LKKFLIKHLPFRLLKILTLIKSSFEQFITNILSFILKVILNNKILMSLSNRLEVIVPIDYKKKLLIHANSAFEIGMRANSCAKEPETVDWLEKYIEDDSVLFDIGANVGTYSLVASAINTNVKVYSFEPSFSNYSQLCRNIVLNKISDRISPILCAISNESGIEVFNYWSVQTGTAISALGEAIDSFGNKFVPELSIPVLKYSLDEIVNKLKIPQPTLIKIDVDGVEKDILIGGDSVLSSKSLKTVLIEINAKDDVKEIIEMFSDKFGLILKEKFLIEAHAGNYIFVRE